MADQTMQGTSIEDIEMGNVKNEADSELMRQIMADIDAGEESATPEMPAQPPSYAPMPMQQMPPMRPNMQGPMPQYMQPQMQIREYDMFEAQEESRQPKQPKYRPVQATKRNPWSQVWETVREPLVVGLIICFLLFPKFHTLGSTYAPWAYSVGGQVSWLGLLVCSVVGAGLWAVYKIFA
jgi:hypothetical protein